MQLEDSGTLLSVAPIFKSPDQNSEVMKMLKKAFENEDLQVNEEMKVSFTGYQRNNFLSVKKANTTKRSKESLGDVRT